MRCALVLVVAVATAACRPGLVFNCASDTECAEPGVTGTCEPTGYCSFTDGSCPEGRRYGEWAGDGLGGACVGSDQPDGGAGPDASPDARTDAPPNAVTVSFGETGTADFSGVTYDTTWLFTGGPPAGLGTDISIELNDWGGVIRFDITAIPPGATIVDATIEFATHADSGNLLTTGDVRLHHVLETWDEATATFTERSTGVQWSSAGAAPPLSSDAAVLGTFTPATEGRYQVDLPALLVQDWLDDQASNAGVMLDTTPNAIGHLHLGSSDGPSTEAPLLYVTYLP